jgi:hypothetical protein
MSDNKLIDAVRNLSDEQLAEIAGGNCTIQDVQAAANDLKQTYETLVEFTSYVIERLAN